jgi:hypothetical protein
MDVKKQNGPDIKAHYAHPSNARSDLGPFSQRSGFPKTLRGRAARGAEVAYL